MRRFHQPSKLPDGMQLVGETSAFPVMQGRHVTRTDSCLGLSQAMSHFSPRRAGSIATRAKVVMMRVPARSEPRNEPATLDCPPMRRR